MKNNTEELALQSINNYHNITAIKTVWNSFKGRQFVQYGEPRKNPRIYGHQTSK